ncbi:tetratricopeptide repeat protein [Brevibacillus reuszeri]|nr:tetratricopeptide repeat protein [Brevibacillus reuszeri]MED1861492.1 tetratricopeptide repeat protein [Brevibacillus reuszeri]
MQFYHGDLVQSKKYFLESMDACLPTNNYGLIAFNLSMLGQVYRFMNDLDIAIYYIKQSLSYSEQYRISYTQMHSLWNLSEIYLAKNDLNKAGPLIHQTLEISRHCDEASKVFPYSSMVKLLRLPGEYTQSFEWGKDALSHANRFDIEPDIGWIYMELGRTYLEAGHAEEAHFHLRKAEEKLTRQLNPIIQRSIPFPLKILIPLPGSLITNSWT